MKKSLRLAAFAAFTMSAHLWGGSIVLTNNLTEPLAGNDVLSTTIWHAISFTTDNNTYTLDTVTLLMELGEDLPTSQLPAGLITNAVTDIAQVSLYTNNGGHPGSLISVLTPTSTATFSLQDVTFAGGGITVSPDSTYWVVLQALSGVVSWGFSSDNNGSGIGFTDDFSDTGNSGINWSTFAGDPDEAEVTADLVAAPEPSSVLLMGLGLLGVAVLVRRNRQGTV